MERELSERERGREREMLSKRQYNRGTYKGK